MNVTKEEMKSKIMNIARDNKLPEAEVTMTPDAEDVTPVAVSVEPMEDEGQMLYNLPGETVAELTSRIADEYEAHYFYRNAANWCHDRNYKKAGAFFDAEADTELVHAKGLQEYMVGFNIIPTIPSVDTKRTFSGLCEIVREAYKLELGLMMKYNTTSSKLFGNDLTTFDFLQTYRTGQKESVVEYNDLINAIELINEENKFEVLYFEQTYF
jgi:ferritin